MYIKQNEIDKIFEVAETFRPQMVKYFMKRGHYIYSKRASK